MRNTSSVPGKNYFSFVRRVTLTIFFPFLPVDNSEGLLLPDWSNLKVENDLLPTARRTYVCMVHVRFVDGC